MTRMLTFLLVLGCVGCAPVQPTAVAPVAPGTECNVSKMIDLIGERATPAVVERAQKRSGANTVRRYETGSMLTQDFRSDRLNVEVGELGRIMKLSCG
ncbi:I78 family peptidase inhibitor [Sphingomonas qomolangmaensis]|uniref:I78 family peptidase inhibitor n=1 Tax=Sphingomonas qomolangmaensis TaxID=2918765 RepID=A0ABY5LBT7_9SPHN|nr:I78 family peptidase inhibitor [Sphingomonas qomolangmaensis]UUL83483.1 I78 family peptidase inhibitor [Sphingomonas qomolangmaensis]